MSRIKTHPLLESLLAEFAAVAAHTDQHIADVIAVAQVLATSQLAEVTSLHTERMTALIGIQLGLEGGEQ